MTSDQIHHCLCCNSSPLQDGVIVGPLMDLLVEEGELGGEGTRELLAESGSGTGPLSSRGVRISFGAGWYRARLVAGRL